MTQLLTQLLLFPCKVFQIKIHTQVPSKFLCPEEKKVKNCWHRRSSEPSHIMSQSCKHRWSDGFAVNMTAYCRVAPPWDRRMAEIYLILAWSDRYASFQQQTSPPRLPTVNEHHRRHQKTDSPSNTPGKNCFELMCPLRNLHPPLYPQTCHR